MIFVRPTPITDCVLYLSNVEADTYPEYDPLVVYQAGDIVQVAYGTAAGAYSLTSTPYPMVAVESAEQTGGGVVEGNHRVPIIVRDVGHEDAEQTAGSVVGGWFAQTFYLAEHNFGFESAEQTAGSVVSGVFNTPGAVIVSSGFESAEQTAGSVVGGWFAQTLVGYNNALPESAEQTGGGVIGGVHEVP